jgi:hypothetical protein
MNQSVHLVAQQSARDDLESRTLSGIRCDLARLIYLASTRDYNSGVYHHEGLASRFGVEHAREALRTSHCNVFRRLAIRSLEELVSELESYVNISREAPQGLIHAWQELEPYRVAVPMEMDSTMVQLFLSNIKLALGVLEFRQKQIQACQPASSLQPLLGQ